MFPNEKHTLCCDLQATASTRLPRKRLGRVVCLFFVRDFSLGFPLSALLIVIELFLNCSISMKGELGAVFPKLSLNKY